VFTEMVGTPAQRVRIAELLDRHPDYIYVWDVEYGGWTYMWDGGTRFVSLTDAA